MDFVRICDTLEGKKRVIFPDFRVMRSQDLLVRGGAFHAVWNESKGLWSTDEYDVQTLVDEELRRRSEEHTSELQSQY